MSKLPVAGLAVLSRGGRNLATIAARWPVAICSGALRPEIEYSLRRLDRLDQVTCDHLGRRHHKCKPDPEGYRLALAALQAHARERQG